MCKQARFPSEVRTRFKAGRRPVAKSSTNNIETNYIPTNIQNQMRRLCYIWHLEWYGGYDIRQNTSGFSVGKLVKLF